MRIFLVIFGLFVVFGQVSARYGTEDGILELTKENFKPAVEKYKFLCVVFHSKKSRESDEFESKYKEIISIMSKESKDIKFASLDMGKHGEIEGNFFVLEIPMLKFFKMGRHYDFRGLKEVKHVKAWLHLAMNVPVVVNTHKEFEDIKKRGTVIVGCFPGNSPADGFKTFHEVSGMFVSAKNIPLPRFAVIIKASVFREVGLLKGTVSVFKHFEPTDKVVYGGSLSDSKAMLAFCEEEAQPIVFPYNHDEFARKMMSSTIKYNHLLFMSSRDSKFKQTFANFKSAAKAFMKDFENIEVMFIHVDTSKSEHQERVKSYFHIVDKNEIPCNRITALDKYHSRFIPPKQDFSKEALIDFTRQVVAGKEKRSVRTELLPGDWDKYPVKVLVGSNYDEFVHIKGKSVFVMYYIPDHKESQEMLPVIDEVGLHYKLNNTVVLATMNVENNDGEVDVHFGYPSFKLFTADNKELKFKGNKNAKAIQAFIDTNGTTHIGAVIDADSAENELDHLAEYIDKQHGIDPNELDYNAEEEREQQWTEEELKLINTAIEVTEGERAEQHDKYKLFPGHSNQDDEHQPDHHDPHIVTDHDEMNPKEHANLGDSTHEEYVPDHQHYGL